MKVLIFCLLFISVTVFGQIPQGYYDGAIGLSGQELRAALQEIIDDHEEQSYASIWTHFQSTDDNPAEKSGICIQIFLVGILLILILSEQISAVTIRLKVIAITGNIPFQKLV